MTNDPENNSAAPQADSTPNAGSEQEGRQQDSAADTPATGPGAGSPPASTQSNLGDGTGIRGSYGDASQTNGLEGGPDSDADGSPKGQ